MDFLSAGAGLRERAQSQGRRAGAYAGTMGQASKVMLTDVLDPVLALRVKWRSAFQPWKELAAQACREAEAEGERQGQGDRQGQCEAEVRRTMRPQPRELEQRHLDLIGLGLMALALYLGFVLYGGSDAGRLGEALQTGLEWLMGAGSYVVPMLLAGVGAALVLRPFVRYPGSLNGGAVLLVAGILLALAAETAGLGPDEPTRDGYFQPDYFTAHGGALGEVLYWASATLLQRVGAHIIAVLLILCGALLLSGRPIAGLMRSAGDAHPPRPRGDRRLRPDRDRRPRRRCDGEGYDDGFPTYPLRRRQPRRCRRCPSSRTMPTG